MKRELNLLLALLLTAGFCLPVFAQDKEAAQKENPAAEAPAEPPAKPAPKKPAPKKKAKKKKPAPPASEYKFEAVDKTETYKFDKKANPIVKAKKKKKTAKKAAPAAKKDDLQEKSVVTGKLRPAKSIGDAGGTATDKGALQGPGEGE